jgi:dipeptidyl aminopeptidase/acylaminoacyl peptidase
MLRMADFADFEQFTSMRRLTGLVASPDGRRVVVTCQEPDRDGARYVSSLWQVDPTGECEPSRLTWSEKGETAPAFLPDGRLMFVSTRPHADQVEDESALWVLPAVGEPTVYATSPGGVSGPVVARESGTVVASGSRLPESRNADDDKSGRDDRRKRKITGIVHDGFPIRYWDHELADTLPRLFGFTESEGDDIRRPVDLIPDAREQLINAAVSLSADGATLATTWRSRRRGGQLPYGLAVLDMSSRGVRLIDVEDGADYTSPALSPDGGWLAAIYQTDGDFDRPMTYRVRVFDVGDGTRHDVDTGDLYGSELVWSTDSTTLFIAGDLHGRGGLASWRPGDVDVAVVLDDAVYSSLSPVPDGSVFALRSTVDTPAQPVRVSFADGIASVTALRSPAPPPELPGSLERIIARAPDGASVGGWLCLPRAASPEAPAPLQVWIHGGPFASHNSWSWRWNAWVAVARGYAVLLPDPALSTGYGHDWLARAWPHRAGTVWADVEAMVDAATERAEIDATRTACLGGSFGGYMTNWIAGHTTRFGAIVTHAGLWALDQQHTTTDAANWKSRLFGTPADHPQWYAENSPHNFVDNIVTPMLIVHGNSDYRVPVSEALRLWWDLVSRFDGEPTELPHRFLQFTGENHWILSPGNALLWWETVQGFVDDHLRR